MSGQAHRILVEEATALGFDRVAVAAGTGAPGIEAYDRFLAEGRHGSMGWMERGRAPRAAPGTLQGDLRSVVVLGVDYGWPRPPDPGGLTGIVSCYAWGRDYHNRVGKHLRRLLKRLRERLDGFDAYATVDSRPVIERAWAERAGLGFLGKNACIIDPGRGSTLFLATLLTNLELEPDEAVGEHCGRCRRCLDACPTGAFTAPGELDARRCISYLTIEHDGPIPEGLRPGMGRWVFGCDACQDVCPHNHKPSALLADFAPLPGRAWLDLPWVLDAPGERLAAHFAGSPIKRACPERLKRNAAVVLGNLGDPAARPVLARAAERASPLVAEHARWALERV